MPRTYVRYPNGVAIRRPREDITIKNQMSRPAAKLEPEATPRAASTSDAEFAAQFQASFRVLWLIAIGIVREASSAEDVVQEAAIIALDKLAQFRPGTSFTAWTGKIVRNVALNRARHERRRRLGNAELLDGAVGAATPEAPIETFHDRPGVEFDRRVAQALDCVGDMARACLLLRTLEGLEYSQIAELLDIPEGTAMSHVHRTRAYLRERLVSVWKERSGASDERAY